MKYYIVPQSYIGLLYEDGSFKKQLEPGKHKIKKHVFGAKERRAETGLIEARKEAEAMKIRSTAESETELRKVQVEKEQVKAMTEVDILKLESRLAAEIKEAQALQANPQLIKLKQLNALSEMSKRGAKFTIGLDKLGLDDALKD